ncbi:MAG: hypothetical protein RL660_3132 [Bacteroidota bacterium]
MKSGLLRLMLPFLILQLIVVMGVIGYMFVEGYTLVEACYMTTLAITTVGFGEVRPLSTAGQIFTTVLCIFSWSTFAFVIGSITQYVVNGEIRKFFKTSAMQKKIKAMEKHVILCGLGRNGKQAALTLYAHGTPFVIVDTNEQLLEKFVADHFDVPYVVGDATDDEVLQRANINSAAALITTLPTDAQNVFIVLSARALNTKLQIISRASETASSAKLHKAGADSVIMPDKIGGTHMATLVSKPDVLEFIDYLSGSEGESINVESVAYEDLPQSIQGKTLSDIMQWRSTGVNCIGIKDAEGKFLINPPTDTKFSQGMKLMVLGDRKQIDAMKNNLGQH